MPITTKFMSSAKSRQAVCRSSLWGLLLAALVHATPARAELAVSQLIVELKPGSSRAHDVELFNESPDRSYVSIEPRQVIDPGTPKERRIALPDPEKLGILVSPTRLILEPRQRRTIRVAAIGPETERERVYRVTVKPVVGDVAGSETGLKLLVGYDLLVLVRPRTIRPVVEAKRFGSRVVIANHGNSSVELAEGKQCDTQGACRPLPGKRLYAGASWEHSMPLSTSGEYRVRTADGWSKLKF